MEILVLTRGPGEPGIKHTGLSLQTEIQNLARTKACQPTEPVFMEDVTCS